MSFVLVVDDNRQMADLLKKMVEIHGIEVKAGYGSRAALEILQNETPAAMFVDLNMPGVTGFDVISYLRNEPRLSEVPIIVVTSDDQPETRQRVQDLGAVRFVVKPIEMQDVDAILGSLGLIEE
jgi:chemosensory pili system protein ChpA (sensor histidine kinase/response regulator)